MLYIYFRPSVKEEWGDEYSFIVFMMLIFWPISIFAPTINLISSLFTYIVGICFDKLDKVIDYVGKKGESRKNKEKLVRNINESKYYGTKNSK
jgi:hypothetical protein